jgi:hypothetical protein
MAIAMLGLTVAQHEEDIHLGYVDSTLAVTEPHELAEPPYTLEYTLEELLPGLYVVDVGWDFHTEEGASHPQLRQVMVQQVFISSGLLGVIEDEDDPIFGEGLPGTWTLTYDSAHQHIIFASNTLPTRDNPLLFKFRLVNGTAFDGTPLNDSVVEYTLKFVPEPASLSVLAAGLGLVALRRRRREVVG